MMQNKAIKLYYDPTLTIKQAGKLVGKDGAVLSRLIKKLGGVYKRDLYMPTRQDMENFVLSLKQNPRLSTVEAAHRQGFTHASMRDTCIKFGFDYLAMKKKAKRKQAKKWARFYFAKHTRTFQDVADTFQVSLNVVFLAFRSLNLKRKPTRGRPGFGFKPEKACDPDKFYFILIRFRNGPVLYKIGRTFFSLYDRFYRSRRMIRRIHRFKVWHGLHKEIYSLECRVKRRFANYFRLGPTGFLGYTETLKPNPRLRRCLLRYVNRHHHHLTFRRRWTRIARELKRKGQV